MNIDHQEFRSYAVNHLRIDSAYVNNYVSQTGNYAIRMGMTPYIIEERQLNISHELDVFSKG